jgi:hypothetical protein
MKGTTKIISEAVKVTPSEDLNERSNLSSRTMVLGSTQPLTEMSTRNLPGQ